MSAEQEAEARRLKDEIEAHKRDGLESITLGLGLVERLAKAEQERDDALLRESQNATAHEDAVRRIQQLKAQVRDLREALEKGSREADRYRDALAAIRDEERRSFGGPSTMRAPEKWSALVHRMKDSAEDALQATQEEPLKPGGTLHMWYCDLPGDHEGDCKEIVAPDVSSAQATQEDG